MGHAPDRVPRTGTTAIPARPTGRWGARWCTVATASRTTNWNRIIAASSSGTPRCAGSGASRPPLASAPPGTDSASDCAPGGCWGRSSPWPNAEVRENPSCIRHTRGHQLSGTVAGSHTRVPTIVNRYASVDGIFTVAVLYCRAPGRDTSTYYGATPVRRDQGLLDFGRDHCDARWSNGFSSGASSRMRHVTSVQARSADGTEG